MDGENGNRGSNEVNANVASFGVNGYTLDGVANRQYLPEAKFLQTEENPGDLTIVLPDGSTVVIPNYLVFAQAGMPPKITLADGSVIPGQEILDLITDLNLDEIAPAAGIDGPISPGSGAAFSDYTTPNIGDDLNHGPYAGHQVQLSRTPSNKEWSLTEEDNQEPVELNAQVSITANDASAAEPQDNGQFTVTLDQVNNTGGPITVYYLVSGSATPIADYMALTGSVEIPNGSSSAIIDVNVIDDKLLEGDESVVVTLTGTDKPTVTVNGLADTATVTIADNETSLVSIEATDPNASETGSDPGQFTVTLDHVNNTGGPITVSYIIGGSATPTADYTALSGTVVIANGTDSATIDVSGIIDDDLLESDETVIVTLTGTDNGAVGVDGSADTATVTIEDNEYAPVAVDDSGLVNEDETLTVDVINGVLQNDSDGDIGDILTVTDIRTGPEIGSGTSGTVGSALIGSYGTLTLNADGSYSYVTDHAATDSLAEGESVNDTFTYTVSDGNGGSDTAALTITIDGVNDAPIIAPAYATVSEEGLANANPDDTGTPSDTTNEVAYSGTLNISDVDSTSFNVTFSTPTEALYSNGEEISWALDGGNQTLTGSTTTGGTIFTATVDNDGNYTVTLHAPLDHPDVSVEDILSFDIGVNVSDGASSSNGTITVNIEDDMPVSGTFNHTLGVPEGMTNVMLIMDHSGSMKGSELVNMKAALIEMLNAYRDTGQVAVQLVSFGHVGTTVDDGGWVSIDSAITYISGLDDSDMDGLATNYDEALAEAELAFAEINGKLTGDGVRNVSYFLSDGKPSPYDSYGINSTEKAAWEEFLAADDNKIDSFAVGFNNADISELQPIAYNGIDDTERPALDATPPNDLTDILVGTVTYTIPETSIFGDINSNGFGADGVDGYVLSIDINGELYTYDVANNRVLDQDSNVIGTGSVFSAETSHGAIIEIDMAAGTYTYTVSVSAPMPFTEGFDCILKDYDGDTSQGTLVLNVNHEEYSGPSAIDEVQMVSPTYASGGLFGEYYAYTQGSDGGNLWNLSDVTPFIENNSADATYIASNLFYSAGSSDLAADGHLETFLGSDAASLSVTDPATGTDAIIHIEGNITLNVGTYNFGVRSDDGYAIYIDGVNVAMYDGIQSATSRDHSPFTIDQSGAHHIEIIYWDAGGNYVFQPELRLDGGSYQHLSAYELQYATQTPGSVHGAVLDNIDFGPDGAGQIDSIAYDGTTYNASDYTSSGNSVDIVTVNGDQLTFNFLSGEYTFDNSVGAAHTETFIVTASDSDGDSVAFDLRFGVTEADNILHGDNARAEQFVIDSADDMIIFDFDRFNDTLDIQDNGIIVGTDDTLLGGAGNDALIGGAGSDVLIGGEGNDLLLGGLGHDALTGGEGDDVFMFTAASDGHDTIADFSVDIDGDGIDDLGLHGFGNDVINLDALFDNLGIASGIREVHADPLGVGDTNTVLRVGYDDGGGYTEVTDFTITLSGVTMADTTVQTLVGTDIIVSDES